MGGRLSLRTSVLSKASPLGMLRILSRGVSAPLVVTERACWRKQSHREVEYTNPSKLQQQFSQSQLIPPDYEKGEREREGERRRRKSLTTDLMFRIFNCLTLPTLHIVFLEPSACFNHEFRRCCTSCCCSFLPFFHF